MRMDKYKYLLLWLDTEHFELDVAAHAASRPAGALNPEHRRAQLILYQQSEKWLLNYLYVQSSLPASFSSSGHRFHKRNITERIV